MEGEEEVEVPQDLPQAIRWYGEEIEVNVVGLFRGVEVNEVDLSREVEVRVVGLSREVVVEVAEEKTEDEGEGCREEEVT